jgi:excisionase family DNA binding protein
MLTRLRFYRLYLMERMMSKGKEGTLIVANQKELTQWLTLKQASEFLGIHYTTLRVWADKGEIPVFRTPGGHRRFSAADLRRFLAARVDHQIATDSDAFVSVALGRVRAEIEKMPRDQSGWRYSLDDNATVARRSRGRQLFALAIAYVTKPKQRERVLEEGRQLGGEYGKEAADIHLGLVETGRAVQFFRSQLAQVLHTKEQPSGLDAEDVRVRQLIDYFLDEVLYSVLDGYEQAKESKSETGLLVKQK